MAKLGNNLKISKYEADQRGVKAVYYLEEGTPDSVIKQAQKWFGMENVITFKMECQ